MNHVYELIRIAYIRGLKFTESEGLFYTEEKAIELKECLKKYNPNNTYTILYRRID